jgi:hypothetical protein
MRVVAARVWRGTLSNLSACIKRSVADLKARFPQLREELEKKWRLNGELDSVTYQTYQC